MLLSPHLWPFSRNSEITDSPHGPGGGLGCGPTHERGEEGLLVPPDSAGERWGASRWPLVHTAVVHPRLPCCSTLPASEWFMWSDLLLSVTSDLWTSWNEPQGEGGKVTEGCLKERLHTSPLWKAKRIIFRRSSIISTLPGHLVGRKTANWWQPWNKQLKRFLVFFYLQVEIIRKGRVWGRNSLRLWHVELVTAGKALIEMLREESSS